MRNVDELHQPKHVGSVSIELGTQPCRIALRCIEGGPSLPMPPNMLLEHLNYDGKGPCGGCKHALGENGDQGQVQSLQGFALDVGVVVGFYGLDL
jgi:hypothetical protein